MRQRIPSSVAFYGKTPVEACSVSKLPAPTLILPYVRASLQDDPAAPYQDAVRHGGGFLVQVRIVRRRH